jgi:hypothetical protein
MQNYKCVSPYMFWWLFCLAKFVIVGKEQKSSSSKDIGMYFCMFNVLNHDILNL